MKDYSLNIAGYKIGIKAAEDGPELQPSERFAGNICTSSGSDIEITVHSGLFSIPAGAKRVFHAPLIEESEGARIKKSENFWSIYKLGSDLFIKTWFPWSDQVKKAVLKFSVAQRQWELWLKGTHGPVDPLDYPLDGLILYYLTAINGDIMIHASGVNHLGKGYVFSGISGRGKTTMAGLWNREGSKVVHDDRLVIRNVEGKYMMYNTPVYRNDSPSESVVSRIFLIGHGKKNTLLPLSGAKAVSLFLANCIQHNWDSEIVARLIGSVSILCNLIPVAELKFKPDRGIIDFILYYE